VARSTDLRKRTNVTGWLSPPTLQAPDSDIRAPRGQDPPAGAPLRGVGGSTVGTHHRLARRAALAGTAGAVTLGIARQPLSARQATPMASPVAGIARTPLWQMAAENGIVYGTSLATWQASDEQYLRLVDDEAGILFTEDDLLWWRLKPSPDAELDFQYGDQFFQLAEEQQQLVFGAHLVWDEGIGEGWTDDDIRGMG